MHTYRQAHILTSTFYTVCCFGFKTTYLGNITSHHNDDRHWEKDVQCSDKESLLYPLAGTQLCFRRKRLKLRRVNLETYLYQVNTVFRARILYI